MEQISKKSCLVTTGLGDKTIFGHQAPRISWERCVVHKVRADTEAMKIQRQKIQHRRVSRARRRGDPTGLTRAPEQGERPWMCPVGGTRGAGPRAASANPLCGPLAPDQHSSWTAVHGACLQSPLQHRELLGHGLFLPTGHKLKTKPNQKEQ